ncbi:MAG: 6-phosphofructokinase [Deltaproteobacteria bacterium]|nr:6-phosphofructokinase [Deltaproteobacteria bacterium]
MRQRLRRIGVLTGGGDCAGLNAVIRAVAKSAILEYGMEVYGIADGFLGLIEDRMHELTANDVSNILTQGGTILGTSNKAVPDRFVTGRDANGDPIVEDVTPRVLEHIAARGLEAVIVIGGDGSMSGAARLMQHGVRMIGVPKTIDNDLRHTDLTFGFQTAVEVATEALDRIHTTAASHHRVMLVETMGRNAGWLALHAGIASGADVILIPEIPYHPEAVYRCCQARAEHRKNFTIIAVAEGARPVDGQVVVESIVPESPDPIRLGGVSTVLARQLSEATGLECRSTILGHVQRGGTPCAFDRVLATVFGQHAVQLVVEGRWNQMVALQHGVICHVGIEKVAHHQRQVPRDAPILRAARAVGTCMGDA